MIYDRPAPLLHVPSEMNLDDDGRCSCGENRDFGKPTMFRECIVYTLTTAQTTSLEVQSCPRCPPIQRHFIGLDGRLSGCFNLNNSVIFTHDLLDDYTAAFTSSETPFAAWANLLQKRYKRHSSPLPFAHEAVFRTAWFAYSNLQLLNNDMRCPLCGPSPDDVIWDGVSLSFHRKHVLPSLRPPTMHHPNSLIRESRYHSQSLIINSDLRRTMRKIIQDMRGASGMRMRANGSQSDDGLSMTTASAAMTWMIDGCDGSLAHSSIGDDISDLLHLVLETHKILQAINDALASCFYAQIGLKVIMSGKWHDEYANLFFQVCTLIARVVPD